MKSQFMLAALNTWIKVRGTFKMNKKIFIGIFKNQGMAAFHPILPVCLFFYERFTLTFIKKIFIFYVTLCVNKL